MQCSSNGKKGEGADEKALPVTANGSSAGHDAGVGGDSAAESAEKPTGQLVELKFRAPAKPGNYNLALLCVSGS